MMIHLSTFFLLLLTLPSLTVVADGGSEPSASCERLKTSLTYKQENAPRDISAVLRVLVEKVNSALDSVIDVEIGWTGENVHRVVGEHLIQATVTRLLPSSSTTTTTTEQQTVTQCFSVPFTIQDTDECHLVSHHPMRHQCPPPSKCVNTIGSYECVCPLLESTFVPKSGSTAYWEDIMSDENRSAWEKSFSQKSLSSCPSSPSTYNCCAADAHSQSGRSCRANFHCPIDPCSSKQQHDCVSGSKCQRSTSPTTASSKPNYTCQCPNGLLGNGHKCSKNEVKPQPKVMYDGVTPTEETLRNLHSYCGCTRPIVDACAGFPPCKGKNEICTTTSTNTPICTCAPGYISLPPYGCVDETPPILKLKCDPLNTSTSILTQGQSYHECAVDIVDENAEEYMRSLKISYSMPLPPGCLTSVGRFFVNYTVATPWTQPPFVRVTRKVIVEDLDECEVEEEDYEGLRERGCGMLIPRCDVESGAMCVNTVGSYECRCPKSTEGDGFLKLEEEDGEMLPVGYSGGTGCRDVSKPVIEVMGPNPKVFRVAKCGGVMGVLWKGEDEDDDEDELEKRRRRYEADIKHMIKSTSGAELCAISSSTSTTPSSCTHATDTTFRGVVDLTHRVTISDPTPIPPPNKSSSSLWWRVAYNVIDDAGNEADTKYRYIQVQELSIDEMEEQMRHEKEEAIKTALELEREKNAALDSVESRESRGSGGIFGRSGRADTGTRQASSESCTACPPCPPCPEPSEPQHCNQVYNTPTATPLGPSVSVSTITSDLIELLHVLLSFTKDILPSLIIFCIVCATIGIVGLIVSKSLLREKYSRQEQEREEILANAITYYSPSPRKEGVTPIRGAAGGGGGGGESMPPPRTSMSFATPTPAGSTGRSPFSQEGSRATTSAGRMSNGSGRYTEDIYERNMSPITPSRSDGRSRGPVVMPQSRNQGRVLY